MIAIREIAWLKGARKNFEEFPEDVQREANLALSAAALGRKADSAKPMKGMTNDDDMELIRGSGNVFRDFGHPDAEVLQLKAILAAKIIGVLDDEKLTVRRAGEITGIAASDFSRIRNVKLDRFTIDRMLTILGRLNQDVEVSVSIQPRRKPVRPAAPHVA